MPYSVELLIEDQKNVLSIHKTDRLTDALDLMIEHDYSQLPVIDEDGRLLGMVTYESILRATRSFAAKIDKLLVCDAIIKAPHHYRDDDRLKPAASHASSAAMDKAGFTFGFSRVRDRACAPLL